MTDDFAIAAAVHYDFELATNPEPFEQLVHDLFGISSPRGEFIHWSTPLKGKRSTPPPAFDLSKLVRRVRRGVASAAVESLRTADSDHMLVVAGTRPREAKPERFTLTKCSYDALIAVGATPLQRLGVQDVIDAIVSFADAVEVRAGVVHCAATSAYATGLAWHGGSGLSLDQRNHIGDLMYFQSQWGDVIRGPSWGTFLSASHVARLGGAAQVETAPCARVSSLRSGGSYLQATSSDRPLLEDDPDTQAALDKLAVFLDPVMGHRA